MFDAKKSRAINSPHRDISLKIQNMIGKLFKSLLKKIISKVPNSSMRVYTTLRTTNKQTEKNIKIVSYKGPPGAQLLKMNCQGLPSGLRAMIEGLFLV